MELVKDQIARFVAPPAGYTEEPPRLMTSNGVPSLLVSWSIPSDPKRKQPLREVNLTIKSRRASGYAPDLTAVEVARAWTKDEGWVRQSIGRFDVAARPEAGRMSGAPFGMPDQVGSIYVFADGDLVVQVTTTSGQEQIPAFISSFDTQSAEFVLKTLTGANR